MSRNRSMKTKKRRNGRRSAAKKAASESAKPASGPTPSPETPGQSSPTKSLLRRAPHLTRQLKARVRKLEKRLDRFERCEKHLAGALKQLAADRDQIHQLNAAMYYVLHQPPHNGDYKDANYNNCFTPKWYVVSQTAILFFLLSAYTFDYLHRERFKWEFPASRWHEHLRQAFHTDGYEQNEPEAWRRSRWAHE